MDNDKLLLPRDKSQLLLVFAIVTLIAALAIMVILIYAGATHQFSASDNVVKVPGVDHKNKVAVIYVEGQMVSDKTSNAAAGSAFSSDIVKNMRKATDDPNVKAIVLRVNSPGGTPVAAEEIISQIHKTRDVKPVVASMGDMATSAAYYISSQTDRIVANPDTFTGSIGVIWVFQNKSKYYNEDGMSFYIAKSGNFKDLGADYRGLSDGEKEYVQGIINESYDRFVNNVASGRNLSVEKVKSIADGRVYTGSDAKDLGLVDEMGGLYDAINVSKEIAHVKGDVSIVYMNEPTSK